MRLRSVLRAAAICAGLNGAALADWQYQHETDKMTGKEARHALAESNNTLSLAFPYSGRNHGNLQVRQHPKYGLDVIVYVDKGQLLCRSHDDSCAVMIKFDDAQPIHFSGTPSADHDSKVIFLRDARRFINRAQKAKRILVQVSVFQNGDQILEFHSSNPLQWDSKNRSIQK